MKRIDWIDVSKGIGIILVVFAHALTVNTYSWNVIQQFHMPLFFILSGFLFKEEIISKKYLLKKIKSLWFPFVIVNAITIIMLSFHQTYLYIFKHLIKIFLMLETTDLFGTTWFLQSLFYISILASILYILLRKYDKNRKIIINFILIAIFMMLGFFIPIKSYHISATIMGMAYYLLGYNFKLLDIPNKFFSLSMIKKIVVFIVCILLLFSIAKINFVSFSKGTYFYSILSVISAISGILLTIMISNKLSKNKLLTNIGTYTLEIMIWHFVAFKLVMIIQMIVYDLDFSILKYHPYYDNSGIWVYLLVLCGLIIPIILSKNYDYIKKIGKKHISISRKNVR